MCPGVVCGGGIKGESMHTDEPVDVTVELARVGRTGTLAQEAVLHRQPFRRRIVIAIVADQLVADRLLGASADGQTGGLHGCDDGHRGDCP